MYAGSFVSSGRIAARIDKIGDDTYISKLTAQAKKYKRPNSEIMKSINLFIKVIGFAIVFVAVFMFNTNFGDNWSVINETGGFWRNLFKGNLLIDEALQKTAAKMPR